MDSEKLIELIREQEFLFDYNDKSYHDTQKKEKAWRAIGKKIGQSGQECKKQWSVLRDSFRRNIRKRELRKSYQSATIIKKWKFEDEMNFLLPYLQQRSNVSSLNLSIYSSDEAEQTPVNDITQQTIESVISNTENVIELPISDNTNDEETDQKKSTNEYAHSAKKKTKTSKQSASAVVMKYLLQNMSEKEDEVEILFYSLAQTVKKMDPYYRALAKSRVCSIIGELEIESITNQSRAAPSYTVPISCPSPTASTSSYSSTNVSTSMPASIVYKQEHI